jgi:hypothetical protein
MDLADRRAWVRTSEESWAQPISSRRFSRCVEELRFVLPEELAVERGGWPLLALTSAKLALVRANKGQSRPHTSALQHYNKTRSAAIFGRLARIIRSPSGKASKLTTRVRLVSPTRSVEAKVRECF